jgi:ribonuclease E
LAGSIADELAPPAHPEAVSAVADFDGASSAAPSSLPEVQPESIAPAAEPHIDHDDEAATPPAPLTEPASAIGPEPAASEPSEKAGSRRSTVREKVTFLSDTQPASAPVAPESTPSVATEPAEPAAGAAPASDAESGAPRRAGWWSRRFGGGE